MPASQIDAGAARRIALAAQGFAQPRPSGRIDTRHVRAVVERVGILQLDSVNVFCRSHYMPVFSRLGPYPREILDRLAAHASGPGELKPAQDPSRRALFEYWGHEASLLPVSTHRLLRWRMARVDVEAWSSMRSLSRENPALIAEVLQMVQEQGPIRAGQTGQAPKRASKEMWSWHDGKVALEYLFFTGQVTAAHRRNFERLYDLPERVLPAAVLNAPTPSEADAQRELVRISAKCLGVASEPDLGDYFRLPRAASKARVAELVEAGELEPVTVEGWRVPGYLSPHARRSRRIQARALLSPFDSLIWARERTERLFGFRYRLEIYTPASRRVYGYYVLPFLLGDSLVARIDLKADRAAGLLRVQGAFGQDGCERDHVAAELAAELRLTARWLGLEELSVARRGDLAPALAAALGR